jgi:hypothetical protein
MSVALFFVSPPSVAAVVAAAAAAAAAVGVDALLGALRAGGDDALLAIADSQAPSTLESGLNVDFAGSTQSTLSFAKMSRHST